MSERLRALIDRASRAAEKPVLDRLSVHIEDSQDVLQAVIREAVRAVLVEHLGELDGEGEPC